MGIVNREKNVLILVVVGVFTLSVYGMCRKFSIYR